MKHKICQALMLAGLICGVLMPAYEVVMLFHYTIDFVIENRAAEQREAALLDFNSQVAKAITDQQDREFHQRISARCTYAGTIGNGVEYNCSVSDQGGSGITVSGTGGYIKYNTFYRDSGTSSALVTSPPLDLDGWPNAKNCPFDQDKGARICK